MPVTEVDCNGSCCV